MEIEKLKKLFDEYDGVIKTSDLTKEGYHNTVLAKLIEKGLVEKIKTGYYEWIDGDPVSDAVVITKLFPEAVVCMNSALFLYGYSERTPLAWHVAVSKNGTKSKYIIEYPPMKFYYLIDSYIEIGKTKIKYEGYDLQIFDKNRTICDVIRYEKKMDKEVFNYAIKAYVQDPKKNVAKLLTYADTMNVRNKVNRIIGMWM